MADNKKRIQQSQCLANPLSGRAGLLRELGTTYNHSAVSNVWAGGLGSQLLWNLNRHDGTSSRPENATAYAFTTFIHDEATQQIIAGVSRHFISETISSIMALEKKPGFHVCQRRKEEQCPQSVVTSISISPSRIMLATTRGGSQPAALYPFSFEEFDSSRGFPVHSKIARNPAGVYWASTANPCQGLCSFAVAASNGGAILQENQGGWSSEGSQSIHGLREVVAVDWLGPSVVLKGGSEGEVRLWDTRSRVESTEPRLQHPTAINHVRSIDENFVIIAGLQNELRTYDLRYSKRASPFHATQPYHKFPTFRNRVSNHLSVGLDVHRNLVAAATDDKRVQIFDVKNGVELASGMKNLAVNAACVKFVDEQRSGNGLKLMVAAGPKIEGWAFEGSGKDTIDDADETHYCKW